jgi:hypothetical protein
MFMRASLYLPIVVAAFATFALSTPAAAQIGSSTDIIIGRVIGPDSAPVSGARVLIVSVTTNATKNTVTRADGRFTILFRDGGGQYRILVTFLGLRPANLTVQRQADEDRLMVTVRMSSNPQQLSTVQVRGRGNSAPAAASSAGGSERTYPTQLLERLPMNPGDLMATAALTPGVVAVGATDSTRASFSVAGQPASQNNITVDGMSFLFGTVPQDAVRATRVVLNAYDVSRGQFTGGQIATTTKSGTSLFQGTANYTGRAQQTQFAGRSTDAFAQKYGQNLISTGLGGPFKKKSDRAFYFVAGEFERRDDDALTLLTARNATLQKLGLSPDSLTSFYAATAHFGDPRFGPRAATRSSTSGSALARLDFDISDAHQLMLRGEYRRSEQDSSRVAPLALPSTSGKNTASGGGAMMMFTSVLGSFINEARVYGSSDRQSAEPYLIGPAGVVTVASLIDNKQQIATLQFGANQALPRSSTSDLQEASDELSWLTEDGAHRLKLGVLVNRDRATTSVTNNRYGVFLFNSLADVGADRPSLFARTLAGTDRRSGSDNLAVYLGDAWRYSPSLQLTYGVRAEGTRLPGAPAANPAVSSAFGRRTDVFPGEVHASPRFGITYLIGNVAGVPSGTFRAGIGEFRGKVPSPFTGYVASNSGLPGAQSQLVCVGPAAPTPDWSRYFGDPSTIPTTCAGGSAGTPLGAVSPNVAVFDDGFGAPRLWRASMAVGRRVFTRYGLGVDALYAYGLHNPSASDMNLVDAPLFTLAGEGRPVFSPKQGIIPISGAVALAASRLHPEFGTAFELASRARSRTGQVTFQLTGGGNSIRSATFGFFSLSYTLMRSTDETNGYPFANSFPSTAGDPRRTEWGTSDFERRHNIIGTTLIVFPHALELSVIGRLLSGPRYTPMISGDVNADGVRNDRAFVIAANSDPATNTAVDTALVFGMQRLLVSADSRARDCLATQRGRIVTRNSCTTPWVPGLDLQLNWRPERFRLDRRATISLVAVNTLAGFDQLMHGSSKMHGWGQPAFPDRMLLNVRAFDSTANAFRYTVNERFGSPSGANNPFRLPFQLGLQVHVMLGADPQREALKSVYGTADGKPPAVKDLKARIYKQFPLPLKMALDAADSLKLNLTPEQLAKLRVANDSVTQLADTLIGAIAEVLSKAGSNPDPGTIAPKLQRTQAAALAIIQRSVTILRTTLTPDQWALLPDRIKFPLQAPAPAPARPQQQRPPS